MKIPVYRPSLTAREKELVNRCLDTSWISSKGEFIEQFEQGFTRFTGVPHATAVCNGTVAIHLALVALGIGPGDEVIVPTFTYIASVNAIHYTGAKPVFVDSLPSTWQLDPADFARKITPRTRAVMPVHLYGHPCEMDEILEIADRKGIQVVEDAAEAFGTRYKGRHAGAFGHVSTFSFFGNKTITTGEGGMVVTADPTLHRAIQKLRGQGLAGDREYWHDVVGFNYRMTNICAAIGCAQLERAEALIRRKREIAEFYRNALRSLPLTFHDESPDTVHSFWMCSVLTRKEQRDPLRAFLRQRGIETRPTFHPAHTMPMYEKLGGPFPVAMDLSARGINLPSWPEISEQELKQVTDSIREFVGPA
jgi:perosamine synthetase